MKRAIPGPRWFSLPLAAALALTCHGAVHAQPAASSVQGVVYDPLRQRMIVFGGSNGGTVISGETWALTLGDDPSWAPLTTQGDPPSARFGHSAIYDPVRDRVIVFGGVNDPAHPLNDVWALSLSGTPTWSRLQPAGVAPLGRYYHSAIYDPLRDRIVIFGGLDSTATVEFADAWSLWLSPTPRWDSLAVAPHGIYNHTAIYDPVRDRMVVFGGIFPRTNETWVLSLRDSTWSLLQPAGSQLPARRNGHSAIYDPSGDRMIVFGGNDGLNDLNDLWQLSLSSATWSPIVGTGVPPNVPSIRSFHSAIDDTASHRMVVFGGFSAADSTWSLSLAGTSTWSPYRPLIDVTPSDTTITATVGDTVSTSFRITNLGMTRLQVSGLELPGSAGAWRSSRGAFSLIWREAMSETLTLVATTPSTRTDSAVVVDNDPLSPHKPLGLSLDVRGLDFEARMLASTPAPLGESLIVVVRPSDGVHLEGGSLHYRIAGSSSPFDSLSLVPLTPGGHDYFTSGIPSRSVTERGVDYFVRAWNGAFSEFQPPGAPGTWSFQQVAPPTQVTPFTVLGPTGGYLVGDSVIVGATLQAGAEFASGWLIYRAGGAAEADSVPMQLGAFPPLPDRPVGTIPKTAVGPRGIEYWMRINTVITSLRYPPYPSYALLQTTVSSLPEPETHPGGRYRMVSIPLDLATLPDSSSLEDLVSGQADFGPYDPTRWRSFRWQSRDSAYLEISRTSVATGKLRPSLGRAFWLIARDANRIDTSPVAGRSTLSGSIVLEPGWNQIGDPFFYPVAWRSAVALDVSTLVTLEPPYEWDEVAQQYLPTSDPTYADTLWLRPFTGYFVWNPSPDPVTLYLPSREAAETSAQPSARVSASLPVHEPGSAADRASWRIRIVASQGRLSDSWNEAGIAATASEGPDALDRSKPPPAPGEALSLYFIGPKPGRRLTVDMRPEFALAGSDSTEIGRSWSFDVARIGADLQPADVSLKFSGLDDLPSNIELRLLDRTLGRSIDIRRESSYRYASGPRGYVANQADARFVLLAGTRAFIEAGSDALPAHPALTRLLPLSPNPMSDASLVRYEVAHAGAVRIEVFDFAGRRVRVLADLQREAGRFEQVWRREDSAGNRLAPGVYFLRLTGPDRTDVRKVALVP